MRAPVPIDTALTDPALLGSALGESPTWQMWRTVLKAAFGLELNRDEARAFASVAGNRQSPAKRVRELWAIIGRRGGKSRMAAAVACYLALFCEHRLAAGEQGMVLVIAASMDQARIVFNYVVGFLEAAPALQKEIVAIKRSEIELKNGIVISVHSSNYRTVRGRTLVGCILDEVAFLRDETSAMPDIEIYRAVLPALATTNGMLIGISTPFRKLGLLYQKHHDHFGIDDDDVLVVQGDSRTFNPMLSELDIANAVADDPEAGLSEWQALFRADITAFLSEADIDACVDHDRPSELPPRAGIDYHAFVDPSGGRHDVFALAIAHKEGESTVVDVLRGRHPPFDTKVVVEEFAALLREYRCREVIGDNYAAGWVETTFKSADIRYVRSDLTKGRLYVEGLPAFTRRTLSLPDNPRLLRELRLLERRTHVGGKDSVDHGRTGSDDLANAVFGVLHYTQKRKQRMLVGTFGYGGPITWYDPATGEQIDPKTKEPIRRTRIRVVHLTEQEAPAVRGLVHSKLGS